MTTYDDVTALAPPREQQLDPTWADATLASILADEHAGRPRRVRSRRIAAGLLGGLALAGAGTAGAAVADIGPFGTVEAVLDDLARDSGSTAYGAGQVGDPVLVARFGTEAGPMNVWTATTADGTLCTAQGFGSDPVADDLEYGCDQVTLDHRDPDRVVALDRPTRLGGFSIDGEGGPLVYGVAPYAGTARVRLEGSGIARTVPVDSDTLGFGTGLPRWDGGRRLQLTWLDREGRDLGSETWVAPVG